MESLRSDLEEPQGELAYLTGARGIYTVQPGDSLSSISAYRYRDGTRWPDVLEANSQVVGDDPDLRYTGMELILPRGPLRPCGARAVSRSRCRYRCNRRPPTRKGAPRHAAAEPRRGNRPGRPSGELPALSPPDAAPGTH